MTADRLLELVGEIENTDDRCKSLVNECRKLEKKLKKKEAEALIRVIEVMKERGEL